MTPGAADSGLTPEQWLVAKRVLHEALALPVAERPAYLDRACAEDAAVRAEVASLLAVAESESGRETDFLERPAIEALGASCVGDDPDRARGAGVDRTGVPPELAAALAGAYVLECEVGRGGMAAVYRARDLRHQRPVALKVLRTDVAAALDAARFRREVLLVARLQHPHIVAVHDSGDVAGYLWFTMPYVEGESLRHRLDRERQLPVADAVQIAREAALALDYAHRHRVIHRDVKPANILLSDGHALVADFGIAKALDTAADAADADPRSHTESGWVPGTAAYMSPEQAAGERALDARTDVYALGLVLYEMLAGVPPAPMVERFASTPAPLPAVRHEVPRALGEVVARALQPIPAHRYQHAAAFAAALEAASAGRSDVVDAEVVDAEVVDADTAPRPGVRRGGGRSMLRDTRAVPLGVRALAVLGAAVAISAVVWWGTRPPMPALDPNRVVVFPLTTAGGGVPATTGADAATLVGYALEGTAPLRWLEGADYLDAAAARGDGALTARARRKLSGAQGAGFYIDGTVMRRGDSATVVLRLHSVAGDSVVARRGASARVGALSVPDLAVRAVGSLLLPLLEPGRRVDVSALQDRAPGAVAEFLEGEREYRASHFARALAHYRAALERDTLFALAALNGAQTATWIESDDAAAPLAHVAQVQIRSLPPYRAAIARGFGAFLAGAADSAVTEFGRAIASDSTRSEPWMGLGEVYRHLLPHVANLDSLAEQAFMRARQRDTTFTPPLYHLAELALRRGTLARASALAREYDRATPDSVASRAFALSIRCARGDAVEWTSAAAVDPFAVIHAGVLLADHPAYAACARTALSAALGAPGVSDALRWMTVLALQNLLVATGRDAALVALVRSPVAHGLNADRLLLLDAVAGAAVGESAAEVARTLGEDYRALTPYRLWLLGSWEGNQGHGDQVRAIARVLAAKADSSRARSDLVMAGALAARAALADGDTTLAIRRLRALTPSAPSDELETNPWECLGGERLLLAQLLLARHDYRGAWEAADALDASHPLTYLSFRRAGLLLRVRAAAAAGADDADARARLNALAHAT